MRDREVSLVYETQVGLCILFVHLGVCILPYGANSCPQMAWSSTIHTVARVSKVRGGAITE